MALFISMRNPRFTCTSPAIVLPRHAEHDHALGLDHPLDDLRLSVFGMPIEDQRERLDNLNDGLMKFRLCRVLRLDLGDQLCNVILHWKLEGMSGAVGKQKHKIPRSRS